MFLTDKYYVDRKYKPVKYITVLSKFNLNCCSRTPQPHVNCWFKLILRIILNCDVHSACVDLKMRLSWRFLRGTERGKSRDVTSRRVFWFRGFRHENEREGLSWSETDKCPQNRKFVRAFRSSCGACVVTTSDTSRGGRPPPCPHQHGVYFFPSSDCSQIFPKYILSAFGGRPVIKYGRR